MKREANLIILIVFLLSATLIFTSCSKNTKDNIVKPIKNSELKDDSTADNIKKNDQDKSDSSSGQVSESSNESVVKTDTGRYIGQIDSNSIEIKISGIPDEFATKVFRFSEKVKNEFNNLDLKAEDVVKIKYVINENKQNILEDIEKIGNSSNNTDTSNTQTDTGRYVGQIDSNSIEIKISGVPDELAARAFRLSDKAKSEFDSLNLKENDVVKVSYTINEYNQNIIEDIQRVKN